MHERGFLKVYEGMLLNEEFGVYMNNPVLVIDKECGTILKMGDEITSNIEEYYNTVISRYNELGFKDISDGIILLKFDRYKGVLDIDEICSVINYMYNSIGKERMNELLQMSEHDLKIKAKELQEILF